MKLRLLVILIALAVFKIGAGQTINISSVKYFYTVSENITSGKVISQNDWEKLFNTSGYSISAQSAVRKKVIKNMMLYAYSDKYITERDSVLKIDLLKNFSNNELFLSRLTLQNYLEMQKNDSALKEFLNNYDFKDLEISSTKRLKEFLYKPVDSLITFPSVNLLCYEPDAQSKPKGIVIDFNYFYKNDGNNDDFLAHEMYHTYRRNFEKPEYIRYNNFTSQLNNIHNEGVADLIDKNQEVSKHFDNLNIPDEIVDMYVDAYKNTPSKLKEFETIVLSFLHKEIDENTFNTKLKYFFQFGGHPNGFYMTSLIVKAGYKNELIKNFYNPHEFLILYNLAARKLGDFVVSDEVVEYSAQIAKQYYR
nr:DUF5700 domain-containing putative Zn-dependent protease [uncultured Carboxylicivirga sp.]